jgi:transcriptional regulator with XRE-family HTH domain
MSFVRTRESGAEEREPRADCGGRGELRRLAPERAGPPAQPRKDAEWEAALAKRARLTRVYITRLESGKQDPSLSTINALAKALGVPVTALLE